MTLTVGSLFAGIGGLDLGLERAGMRVIWQSEIDPYASAVLRKHWPDVPNLGDIRAMRNVPYVDVICGGFPCQDISVAGKGAGIEGERSGLWREYARVIGEVRPRFVIVENVAALLGRGLSRVLGDLAALGYDAEWHCIPASYAGAPHRRDRLWIVADAGRSRREMARHAEHNRGAGESREANWIAWGGDFAAAVSNAAGELRDERDDNQGSGRQCGAVSLFGNSYCAHQSVGDWWRTEPDVGRVANGVPARVDRLRCLGNAIVPQIAELIGRAIVSAA